MQTIEKLNDKFPEIKKVAKNANRGDILICGACLLTDKRDEYSNIFPFGYYNINNITVETVIQHLELIKSDKVLFCHDLNSKKVNSKIVQFAKELKKYNADIEFFEFDINEKVSSYSELSEKIKPFDVFKYAFNCEIETAEQSKNKDIPALKWYVPDLFPSRGLILVASEPKLGKSSILLNFAYCLANGIPFWNSELEPTKVAYIDIDGAEWDTKDRLEYFDNYYNIHDNRYSDNLLTIRGKDKNGLIKVPLMDTVETDENGKIVEKYDTRKYLEILLTQKPDIKVIILDTTEYIKPPIPRNVEQNTFENMLYSNLNSFAENNDVALILVTHLTKQIDYQNPLNSIRGSVGIQATTIQNIVLYRNAGDREIFLDTSARRAKDIKKKHLIKDGDFTFKLDTNYKDTSNVPIDDRVARTLDLLIDKTPNQVYEGTSTEIYNAISGSKTGLTNRKITQEINKVLDENQTDIIKIPEFNLAIEIFRDNKLKQNKIRAMRYIP